MLFGVCYTVKRIKARWDTKGNDKRKQIENYIEVEVGWKKRRGRDSAFGTGRFG